MNAHTVHGETPSVQDIYSANGASALPDSPCDEQDFTEDQRAFLESIAAEEPGPTDEDIDKMYAEAQVAHSERELEDIAAEFLAAYERYLHWVVECDQALVEKQNYEAVAKALGAA